MRARLFVGLLLLSLAVVPPAWGQMGSQPETRIVTVTTFHMPFSKFGEFFEYLDKHFLASDRENPHMLGFKYMTHNWGGTNPNVWLITEYKDLGEIQRAEDWREQRLRRMVPDSTQRAAINREFQEKFGEYFSNHTDNILIGQVKRMK